MHFDVILWYVLVGVLLVAVGAAGPFLRRAWFSTSILYLGIGMAFGPAALGLLGLTVVDSAKFLEHLTEIAVVVSLFAAGLKMRLPPSDRRWLAPALLATATMVVTIAGTATLCWLWAGLPLGLCVLLGAVLAPTDPVLAGEVQVRSPDDEDRLRLMLTGEAGLNDGMAFPFVLLAVGLIGLGTGESLHELGPYGIRWLAVDVVWRVGGGLLIGWYGGSWLAAGAIWCRRQAKADPGSDEMLSLGLIALVYGTALLCHTYAFLAVFAAAVAFRRLEVEDDGEAPQRDGDEETREEEGDRAHDVDRPHEVDHPEHAPAILLQDQVEVTSALEKLVEVTLVVLVGALILPRLSWDLSPWWLAAGIVLVVRPVAVHLTLRWGGVSRAQRALAAWFGIRGIGTIYYLTHAIGLGAGEAHPDGVRFVADVCLATITLSILLHGTSVTPLMRWYRERCETSGSIRRTLRPGAATSSPRVQP